MFLSQLTQSLVNILIHEIISVIKTEYVHSCKILSDVTLDFYAANYDLWDTSYIIGNTFRCNGLCMVYGLVWSLIIQIRKMATSFVMYFT